MPIYIDPTEAREDTRLPQSVIKVCRVLPGLESMTGADMLVTGVSGTIRNLIEYPAAARSILRYHCEHGAILIQRKSGMDFLQSIPHLKGILLRMQEWARPGGIWLLITSLESAGDMVYERETREHGKTAASVQGAIDWWRLRGGITEILPDDESIGGFLDRMLRYSREILENPAAYATKTRIPPRPRMPKALQALREDAYNWVTTGLHFPPGWGEAKRQAVWDSLCQDNIYPSLRAAHLRLIGGQVKVSGIGPKSMQAYLEWVGPLQVDEENGAIAGREKT